jgi:2-oxoglutarate dehydrogenase E2 component (dihydrolipoamide succinyltransferase)
MKVDILIPSVGESITEAVLAEWYKNDGDRVQKEEPLLVIETDKVTLEVAAEAAGIVNVLVPAGETVKIGSVVGRIEAEPGDTADPAPPEKAREGAPSAEEGTSREKRAEPEPATTDEKSSPAPSPVAGIRGADMPLPPSVRRLIAEKKLDPTAIAGSGPGGKITKGDVLLHLENIAAEKPSASVPGPDPIVTDGAPKDAFVRKPMSPIRRRIAARLLEAKQNTAMLTTFNEIDMSRVMALRQAYKVPFKEKHQVSLGYMSFFINACIAALKQCPQVNAFVDGNDIVYHHYYHVGVAIGSGKGLVVPVIHHADRLDYAGIEKAIVDFVKKIENNRLALADLQGGTFTISNGGIYGSLLSTPILNSPQSGILGMHKIEKRPVVVDDEVVIRPMMYVALSYDHRIVDGREAVTCLKQIKACIENPERMLLEV